MKRMKKRKGFTIVELVIVIAVIAILATTLLPTFGNVIQNAQDAAAKQEAKNAFTSYMVANAGKGEMPEYMVYEADGIFVALHNGAAMGVYGSAEEALKSMVPNADPDKLVANGKLLVYGGVVTVPSEPTDPSNPTNPVNPSVPSEPEKVNYSVQLDKNILTLTSDKGLNEVLTLPDPNLKFTHADMKSGVVVRAGQPAPAEGFHVQFKTADINKALYLTAKNIPEGYTLKYSFYAFYADGSNSASTGGAWNDYTKTSRVYNPAASILAYDDYAISCVFYSTETGAPVEAPDGDWEVLIHYENPYSPAEYTYKIVDINGTGDYTSVVEAVEKEPENTVLVILPGTYEGTVRAFTKSIIMVGVDKETCILKSYDGRRENPVLEASCGYVANLTMHSEYVAGVSQELSASDSGAYAIHIENEYGVGKTMEIRNCRLISDFFPALGVGMRKDFTLIVEDCELISNQVDGRGSYASKGSLGALYFHDSVGAAGNSYIVVKNCTIKAELENAICPYTLYGNASYPNAIDNKVYCTFINNTIDGEIWDRNGNAFEKNFVLTQDSSGNTLDRLNHS